MHVITTHKGADFDAFASLMAATLLYPSAVPVLPKNINQNVKGFLSIHKDLFEMRSSDEIDPDTVDKLIVVDTNSWSRLDYMRKLKNRADLEIILWDHHRKGDIHPTWKCQEDMGATITLLMRPLKEHHIELTPILSTLFLAGLYEDTGNLTFPSTKAEDAYAAAYLIENKADLNIVNSFLRPAYGKKQKDILFDMLNASDTVAINGFRIGINKAPIKGHVGNLSVVVQMFREILNADAAFGIFVDKDRERSIVIGRSNVDELNIGEILKPIGGGGHPNAGSAMIKSLHADQIEESIIEIIKGNKKTSIAIRDIMSSPVFTVSSDTSMEQVAMLLREKGVTGIPIVDDDTLVGIISRRDFRKARRKPQMKVPVKAFMHTNVISIDMDKNPMEAARLMVKHDIGRLPVIKDGHLAGIISRSDLMSFFYNLLPE